MISITELPESPVDQDLVLAVGTFDGIHLGHQALLEDALTKSRELGTNAAVLTFDPDPVYVLGDTEVTDRRLLTGEHKTAIIDRLGFDKIFEIKFDREFAQVSPEQFVEEILINRLNARSVHVGFNFRFGHKRQGDTELLREKLNEAGVELSVKDPVELNGETVSSTTIRELVRSGDVEDARRYLGRPYVTRESLQPGQGRGRSIGFPTFNFPLRRTIHPRRGVYTVWLQDDETLYQAVANFGRHPTVGEAEQPLLEVHVLESPPDLSPGDVACVHFGSFIREEKEFESIDRLKNQIDEDVDEARSDHDVLESPDVIRRSDSSDINQVVTEV